MFALSDEKRSVSIFEALSDSTRLTIVKMLLSKEMTAEEITSKTGKARSTIERHLDSLMEAGLIERRKGEDRAYIYYATPLAKEVLRVAEQKPLEEAKEELTPKEVIVELPIKRPLLKSTHMLLSTTLGLSAFFLIVASLTSVPMWILGIILGLILSIEEEIKKTLGFLLLSSIVVGLGSALIIGGGPVVLTLTIGFSLISVAAIGVIFWVIARLLRQVL